ncbi:porin, partial [Pantoea dispersa]|uniref:porin n=2 Tax=Erwiniaceae TaxID=1903409 RepID=UPI000735DFD0
YGRNYGVLYDAMSYTDQLPVFGDDTLYQDNDNFMTGRSNGLATYRNSNFFGLVDGLGFAVQYQGKNEGRGPRYDNGDGWGTSLSYDTGMGISAVGAYFSSDRTNQQQLDGNGEKADAYGFGLKYDANNVYLAAFYGESRNLTQYGNNGSNIVDGVSTPYNFAANKAQAFEVVAQYQFDFGLRPSIAYLQSKGKDLNSVGTFGGGDADLVKYIEVGTYYYFNKNMSTYVDYKINLLDDNDFTRSTGTSTDDVVGVGLVYQF